MEGHLTKVKANPFPLLSKSAIWHTTSELCESLRDFYEFLSWKLSSKNLLIEGIKLRPPPRTWLTTPTSLQILFWNTHGMQDLFHIKLPSLASKREHVTPKRALIGCQTWHDWLSNIWSLADRNSKFRAGRIQHTREIGHWRLLQRNWP